MKKLDKDTRGAQIGTLEEVSEEILIIKVIWMNLCVIIIMSYCLTGLIKNVYQSDRMC